MGAKQVKAWNDEFLAQLSGDGMDGAVAAVCQYTRLRMYRLQHIPLKYFLGGPGAGVEVLARELADRGFIDLDRGGEPCCLSGNPPVLGDDQGRKEKACR